MRLIVGTAAAAIVALAPLAADAAYAQEAPKGATEGPPSLWRLGLNADAMWYENGTFTSSETDSTWSTGGRVGLDYSRRFRTGMFSAGGWGGTVYYPEEESLRQAVFGGSLGLSVAPSPRTQVTVAQSFARTNTRLLQYGAGDVPLPTTGVYYLNSSAGISHTPSPSWQTSVSSSFGWRRYDDRSLVDGKELGAAVQLARILGRSGAAYTSYQFTNNWYADTQSQAHQMLVGGRYQPKRGLSFEGAGGAAYLLPAEVWYPAGNARISANGRRTSLTLAYRRDFGQTYGYGRQTVGDIVSASAGWTPIERFSLSAGYSYSHRRDAADTEFDIRSQVLTGGLSWGSSKGFAASASYSWEQNQTEGFPRLQGGRAIATISYGVEWR
jgi:hypothetical protein